MITADLVVRISRKEKMGLTEVLMRNSGVKMMHQVITIAMRMHHVFVKPSEFVSGRLEL